MSRWHPTWATPVWTCWALLGAAVQWAALRHGPTQAKLSRHVEALRVHPASRPLLAGLWGWLTWHWWLEPRWLPDLRERGLGLVDVAATLGPAAWAWRTRHRARRSAPFRS